MSSLYTNPGFRLPSLKGAWYIVYPEQKRDVREILRNVISCLEDWKLKKNDFSRKVKIPDWYIFCLFFRLPFLIIGNAQEDENDYFHIYPFLYSILIYIFLLQWEAPKLLVNFPVAYRGESKKRFQFLCLYNFKSHHPLRLFYVNYIQ